MEREGEERVEEQLGEEEACEGETAGEALRRWRWLEREAVRQVQVAHAQLARTRARRGVPEAEGVARQVVALRGAREAVRWWREVRAARVAAEAAWEQRERWRKQAVTWRTRLRQEYGGYGPQYEVLVEQVIRALYQLEVLEAIEAWGGEVAVERWEAAHRILRQAVQALQKYTEAVQTEVLQRSHEAVLALVGRIGEQVLQPQAPQLWSRFIEELDLAARQLPQGQ